MTTHILKFVLLATALIWVSIAGAAAPAGWNLAGTNPKGFEVGTLTQADSGQVAYLKSKTADADGFGTLMQTFSAQAHRGQRLRVSASIKTTDVSSWSGLWMRIDGPISSQPLGFDNMQNRPIVGTTDWHRHEVVLDVPPDSKAIAFGVLLVGDGEVLLDNIVFDVVDDSVAVTGPTTSQQKQPINLNFDD